MQKANGEGIFRSIEGGGGGGPGPSPRSAIVDGTETNRSKTLHSVFQVSSRKKTRGGIIEVRAYNIKCTQILSGVVQNARKWASGGVINACKVIGQWWQKMNEFLRGDWVLMTTHQRKHVRTRQQRFKEFLQTLIRVDFQLGVKIIWEFVRGLLISQGLKA